MGKGLCAFEKILLSFLRMQPCARAGPTQNRNFVEFVLHQYAHKKINSSAYSDEVLARWFQQRLTIILDHVRRITRDPDKDKECVGPLDFYQADTWSPRLHDSTQMFSIQFLAC